MQVYVEHNSAFYSYGMDEYRAIVGSVLSLPESFDPDRIVTPDFSRIGTPVYFEGVGWTKTGSDTDARKVRSCEGCALRNDGRCALVKKYGPDLCAGVIFRKIEPAAPKIEPETKHDAVNHPAHYTSHPSGVECIQITEHHNFCIGNAIKYLWRQGLKTGASNIEDLEKAVWYIKREIERIKTEGETK